ncbi:hypothetical protein Scep_023684 [Stephania cephalantha]|uniref:Uncharacterized protein n=1 Tax=Stephania cephalantha TaxID=152367 RepID=A0AAP0F430_9MAGN
MSSRARNGDPSSVCCLGKESDGEVELTVAEETERVPFDINLPVVLAGFAFEAYTSPPVQIALRFRSVRTRKVRTTRTTRRRADSSSSKPRVRPGERHRRGAAGAPTGTDGRRRRGSEEDD